MTVYARDSDGIGEVYRHYPHRIASLFFIAKKRQTNVLSHSKTTQLFTVPCLSFTAISTAYTNHLQPADRLSFLSVPRYIYPDCWGELPHLQYCYWQTNTYIQ